MYRKKDETSSTFIKSQYDISSSNNLVLNTNYDNKTDFS